MSLTNHNIADEYKSYWILSSHHLDKYEKHLKRKIEIREHFKDRCFHQNGVTIFAGEYCCVDCGVKMRRSTI